MYNICMSIFFVESKKPSNNENKTGLFYYKKMLIFKGI